MKYSRVIIYYFSGTGNSENVARWFLETAKKHSVKCETINIANAERPFHEPPPAEALLVFVSPVHGFNYPPIMLSFISRFPKGKNKIVLMNTRAGMLLGKFVTPGLTGIAFYLSALILKVKGYSLSGMLPVNLPSNWISVHPGLNERTVKYLHEKSKVKVSNFTEKILAGKKYFICLREIVQDLLISPIAFGYYFAGRFFFAKTYYASADCNNCELCSKNCPVKAIIKIDDRPFWTIHCESCMRCMSNCPKKAIETGHGFVIGFLVLFYNIFLIQFYKYLNIYFFRIENELAQMLIETGLFLLMMTISYRLFHYLLRFKFFERIIVFTSLTKYKFWGRRYKALKNI